MRAAWVYPHGDEALFLWSWCARYWQLPLYPGQDILEVGAAETDFHRWITHAGLTYTGIDVRHTEHATEADVLTWEPEQSFDWVVFLGTLEHIGLGYYKDPVDTDGDCHAIRRAAEWLLPGGMLYYDVPFSPVPRVPENRHFRVYDARALEQRLTPPGCVELGRMYCTGQPRPGMQAYAFEPMEPADPYYFCSRWFVKGIS